MGVIATDIVRGRPAVDVSNSKIRRSSEHLPAAVGEVFALIEVRYRGPRRRATTPLRRPRGSPPVGDRASQRGCHRTACERWRSTGRPRPAPPRSAERTVRSRSSSVVKMFSSRAPCAMARAVKALTGRCRHEAVSRYTAATGHMALPPPTRNQRPPMFSGASSSATHGDVLGDAVSGVVVDVATERKVGSDVGTSRTVEPSGWMWTPPRAQRSPGVIDPTTLGEAGPRGRPWAAGAGLVEDRRVVEGLADDLGEDRRLPGDPRTTRANLFSTMTLRFSRGRPDLSGSSLNLSMSASPSRTRRCSGAGGRRYLRPPTGRGSSGWPCPSRRLERLADDEGEQVGVVADLAESDAGPSTDDRPQVGEQPSPRPSRRPSVSSSTSPGSGHGAEPASGCELRPGRDAARCPDSVARGQRV